MAASTTTIETSIGTFTVEQDATASGKPAPRWRIVNANGDQTAEVFPTKKAAVEALESHVESIQAEGTVEVREVETPAEPVVEAEDVTPEPAPVVEDAPVEDAPAPKAKASKEPGITGKVVGFHKGNESRYFGIDEAGVVWMLSEDEPVRRRTANRELVVSRIKAGTHNYNAFTIPAAKLPKGVKQAKA